MAGKMRRLATPSPARGESLIHTTAVISPRAELGRNVRVGPYAVIADDVEIGDETSIGSHVVIDRWTRIGRKNQIFAGAVIGTQSQDRKYRGERTYCVIGDNNVIREYVTINRATVPDARTVIGHHNAILAYCHVAHDCILGSHITISNVTTLAGHVQVEDRAGLGGYVGVHQFCRIGTLAYVGGWSKVTKDVPPYFLADGAPLKVCAVNTVGLERAEIPALSRRSLRKAYNLLYRSNNNVSQAVELIERDVRCTPEIEVLLEFLRTSERGICKNSEDPHVDHGASDDCSQD